MEIRVHTSFPHLNFSDCQENNFIFISFNKFTNNEHDYSVCLHGNIDVIARPPISFCFCNCACKYVTVQVQM